MKKVVAFTLRRRYYGAPFEVIVIFSAAKAAEKKEKKGVDIYSELAKMHHLKSTANRYVL